jgi:hypothetical protein
VNLLASPDGCERVYSHHSPASCALSAAAHDNHALDALDLVMIDAGLGAGASAEMKRSFMRELAERAGLSAPVKGERTLPIPKAPSPQTHASPAQSDLAWWDNHVPLVSPGAPRPALAPASMGIGLGAAIAGMAATAQVPLEMAAAGLLVSASSVVQRHVDVIGLQGKRYPAGLYSLILAHSGEGKSSMVAPLVSAIRAGEVARSERMRPLVAERATEIEAYARTKAHLLKSLSDAIARATDEDGGEGIAEARRRLDAFNQRIEPKPIALPDSVRTDATIEALCRSVAEQEGVFLEVNEGGVLLGGHSAREQGQRFLAVLNKLFDGSRYRIDRVSTGALVLEDPRLALLLQIQPGAFAAFVRGDGKGMRDIGALARFLICAAPPMAERIDRTDAGYVPPTPELLAFYARLEWLAGQEAAQGRPLAINLEPGAKALLEDTERRWRPTTAEGQANAEYRDLVNRICEQAARLSAVFVAFDGVELNAPPGAWVNEGNMRSAIHIAEFYFLSARRVLGELEADAELTDAAFLWRWLHARQNETGAPVARRAAMQFVPRRRLRSASAMDRALTVLTQHRHARLVGAQGGAVIELNPLIEPDEAGDV